MHILPHGCFSTPLFLFSFGPPEVPVLWSSKEWFDSIRELKKQDKSLKLSSCHHLFPINLHLAKMDTTTDATAANCKHKMSARTINNGMCHTAKPPLQSSQMPYLHVSAKCGTGHCWREASFAVDIHTHRSSAGLTVLRGTCLVCDTVFRAAVHSDNRKCSWLSLGHKAGGPDS